MSGYTPRVMLDQVQRAFECHPMAQHGDLLLVTVSGGADSVALLQLCEKFGLRLAVAHLHHGIRGAAADADAAFVRRLAACFFATEPWVAWWRRFLAEVLPRCALAPPHPA